MVLWATNSIVQSPERFPSKSLLSAWHEEHLSSEYPCQAAIPLLPGLSGCLDYEAFMSLGKELFSPCILKEKVVFVFKGNGS